METPKSAEEHLPRKVAGTKQSHSQRHHAPAIGAGLWSEMSKPLDIHIMLLCFCVLYVELDIFAWLGFSLVLSWNVYSATGYKSTQLPPRFQQGLPELSLSLRSL